MTTRGPRRSDLNSIRAFKRTVVVSILQASFFLYVDVFTFVGIFKSTVGVSFYLCGCLYLGSLLVFPPLVSMNSLTPSQNVIYY
jgi:hypothetical protein